MNENKQNEKNKKSIAKEWGISLIVTIAIAFAIKVFLFDIYSIPTGSMEPLLHGVEHSGDRVFCTKFNYYLRDKFSPKRWEIFVFKYPGEGQHKGENYIIRCVGLPEESLYIMDGDIYIKKHGEDRAHLSKKPLELQESLWIPIYSTSFSRNSKEALDYHWESVVNGGKWSLKDGKLHGNSNTAIHLKYKPMSEEQVQNGIPDRHVKRQVVTFVCNKCEGKLRKTVHTQQLTAFCPECGEFLHEANIDEESFKFPGAESNNGLVARNSTYFHLVSDLKQEFDLGVESNRGKFLLEIWSEWKSCKTVIPLDGGKAQILVSGIVAAESKNPVKLEKGKEYRVKFYRYDGEVALWIDGKKLLEHNLDLPLKKRHFEADRSGITISLENANITIDNLSLWRDIHYFPLEEKRHIEIFEDSFFALGDNSPTSRDSRAWGFVPRENLIGPAIAVWWPLHRIKILK